MSNSILTSTKKTLGLAEDYTPFDAELVIHINSALSRLFQLGVGPSLGFMITGPSEVWNDFMGPEPRLNSVKTYIHYSVKMAFDPPENATVLQAIKDQIEKTEYLLECLTSEIPNLKT